MSRQVSERGVRGAPSTFPLPPAIVTTSSTLGRVLRSACHGGSVIAAPETRAREQTFSDRDGERRRRKDHRLRRRGPRLRPEGEACPRLYVQRQGAPLDDARLRADWSGG